MIRLQEDHGDCLVQPGKNGGAKQWNYSEAFQEEYYEKYVKQNKSTLIWSFASFIISSFMSR